MDKQLEKFYEDQFDMFLHPGWKAFMEDLERVLKPLEDITTVLDAHDLKKRQGQIKELKWILSRPEAMKEAYEHLKQEGSDA